MAIAGGSWRWQRTARLVWGAVFVAVLTPVSTASASYPGDEGRIAYEESLGSYRAPYSEIATIRPDGGGHLFITDDGGRYIRTISLEDGPVDVLTMNTSPQWLPGGDRVAFLHVADIERVELRTVLSDGSGMRVISRDWPGTVPSWSPDSSRMAYGTEEGLWVANADGTSAVLVAAASAPPAFPEEPDSGYPWRTVEVAWSSVGDRIAFVEWSGEGLMAGFHAVSLVDADGSNRIPFVCNGHWIDVDWHPDGSEFLCTRDDEGSTQRVSADGNVIESDIAFGDRVAWSPNGARFVYAVSEDQDMQLWSYEPAPGSHQMIVANFDGRDLSWQALQGTFWDDDTSLFETDIEWMAAEGITRGCNPPTNDRYCPGSSVTRGQMAAFLVRALDLPAAPSAGFTDTVETTFEQDIDRLAAAGITRGCNPPANDRFCPDDNVRREVMAAFLVRALDYTDDGGGDLFGDDDGSIFETDIDKLATAGVTKGCNPPVNDRFCPTQNVTRGQMAAFLHRALG